MIKKFKEFILEGKLEASFYFDRLRRNHSKSPFVEQWIDKVEDLLNGKLDSIPRSEFRKSRGDQFGLDFVDSLVQAGILTLIKKGRKQILSSAQDNDKKFKDELNSFLDSVPGVVNWDESKKELNMEMLVSNEPHAPIHNVAGDYKKKMQIWLDRAEEVLRTKYSNVKIKKRFESFEQMLKKNRYLSNTDIVGRYYINIKVS